LSESGEVVSGTGDADQGGIVAKEMSRRPANGRRFAGCDNRESNPKGAENESCVSEKEKAIELKESLAKTSGRLVTSAGTFLREEENGEMGQVKLKLKRWRGS